MKTLSLTSLAALILSVTSLHASDMFTGNPDSLWILPVEVGEGWQGGMKLTIKDLSEPKDTSAAPIAIQQLVQQMITEAPDEAVATSAFTYTKAQRVETPEGTREGKRVITIRVTTFRDVETLDKWWKDFFSKPEKLAKFREAKVPTGTSMMGSEGFRKQYIKRGNVLLTGSSVPTGADHQPALKLFLARLEKFIKAEAAGN